MSNRGNTSWGSAIGVMVIVVPAIVVAVIVGEWMCSSSIDQGLSPIDTIASCAAGAVFGAIVGAAAGCGIRVLFRKRISARALRSGQAAGPSHSEVRH